MSWISRTYQLILYKQESHFFTLTVIGCKNHSGFTAVVIVCDMDVEVLRNLHSTEWSSLQGWLKLSNFDSSWKGWFWFLDFISVLSAPSVHFAESYCQLTWPHSVWTKGWITPDISQRSGVVDGQRDRWGQIEGRECCTCMTDRKTLISANGWSRQLLCNSHFYHLSASVWVIHTMCQICRTPPQPSLVCFSLALSWSGSHLDFLWGTI